LKLFEH